MLNNIQILRFIAAAMVVFAHGAIAPFGLPETLLKSGRFGVDIFFVISGFLMPYILFGGPYIEKAPLKLSGPSFFLRRLTRIWPMYFAVTMLVIVGTLVVNSGLFSPSADLAFAYRPAKLDPTLLFESLTFTHSLVAPTLNVGWTLQFEFMFYTIIALLISAGVKRLDSLILATSAIIFLAILVRQSVLAPYLGWFPPVKLMGQPMMIEFLWGMIIYRLHSNSVHLSKLPAIVILTFAIPTLIAIQMLNLLPKISGQPFFQPFVWGSIASLIVWAALSLEGKTSANKLLVTLGNSSYCLYLVHWILMPWIAHFFYTNNLYSLGPIFFFAVYFSLCQTAGFFVHKYIENPINLHIKNSLDSYLYKYVLYPLKKIRLKHRRDTQAGSVE